jgi:nucleoside 2-deoxyribosyltransferase
MKRIIRDRHLTSEEAAKYKAVRDQVEAEKPEINARILARMAEKRGGEKGANAVRQTAKNSRRTDELLFRVRYFVINPDTKTLCEDGYSLETKVENANEYRTPRINVVSRRRLEVLFDAGDEVTFTAEGILEFSNADILARCEEVLRAFGYVVIV